jgi:hypothetical protein
VCAVSGWFVALLAVLGGKARSDFVCFVQACHDRLLSGRRRVPRDVAALDWLGSGPWNGIHFLGEKFSVFLFRTRNMDAQRFQLLNGEARRGAAELAGKGLDATL